MEHKKNVSVEIKHAILYLILSGIWSIVDYCVFLLLTNLGLFSVIANIISYTCGMVTSFSLNLKKNFKQKDNIKNRFFSYVFISLIWIAISTCLIYYFIEIRWINPWLSKIFQILIVAIPLYIFNRLFTFRKSKDSTYHNIHKNAPSKH